MEWEFLEHGRKLIDEMRISCQQLLDEGEDQRYAEDSVLDATICNNYDLAAILWASGCLSEAWREVHEEVETYIFDPVRE